MKAPGSDLETGEIEKKKKKKKKNSVRKYGSIH
jgi:hypothetical protein